MTLIAALAIVGAFGASVFGASVGGLFLQYKLKAGDFPQSVPKYQTRMRRCPWRPDEVQKVMDNLIAAFRQEYPQFSKRVLKAKLNGVLLDFVKGENGRYVIDRWGRKVSGYHDGNTMVTVFLGDDEPGDTALIHELAHELEEVFGPQKAAHNRVAIWGSEADGFKEGTDDPRGIVQKVQDRNR